MAVAAPTGSHVVVDIGSLLFAGRPMSLDEPSRSPRSRRLRFPSRPTPRWICGGSTAGFRSTGSSRSRSPGNATAASRTCGCRCGSKSTNASIRRGGASDPFGENNVLNGTHLDVGDLVRQVVTSALPFRAGVQRGVPRVVRDLRTEQESGRRLRLPDNGRQRWRISSGKPRARRRVAAGRQTGSSIPVTTVECPQCHQPKRPHFVCDFCGTYDGRQVVTPRDERDHAGHTHE